MHGARTVRARFRQHPLMLFTGRSRVSDGLGFGVKGGVFAQRGHSANYYVVLSRAHPCKPPPYRSVQDQFKTASGVQSSGPWDPCEPSADTQWNFSPELKRNRPTHQRVRSFAGLPVENSRLYA